MKIAVLDIGGTAINRVSGTDENFLPVARIKQRHEKAVKGYYSA